VLLLRRHACRADAARYDARSLDDAFNGRGVTVEVLNVLGAGDAFAAGFLGSLVAGAAPVDAARAGHRVAAAAIATVSSLEP
jgi:sugar/nucleoside kinase (ribokinase family)